MVGNLQRWRPMTSHIQPASVRCTGDKMRESRESLTGFEEGPQIPRGSKELENLWVVRGEIGATGSWNGPSSTKFLPRPRDRGPMYSRQRA